MLPVVQKMGMEVLPVVLKKGDGGVLSQKFLFYRIGTLVAVKLLNHKNKKSVFRGGEGVGRLSKGMILHGGPYVCTCGVYLLFVDLPLYLDPPPLLELEQDRALRSLLEPLLSPDRLHLRDGSIDVVGQCRNDHPRPPVAVGLGDTVHA